MLNSIVLLIGKPWITSLKYSFSKTFQKSSWDERASSVISLPRIEVPEDIISGLKGKLYWKPDPLFQVFDIVRCPRNLYNTGGDDCDGWAMLHAQLVNDLLKSKGWHASIMSYITDPFKNSHHFCLMFNRFSNKYYALQPQFTLKQYRDNIMLQHVYGPYSTKEETAKEIAKLYKSKVLYWVEHTDNYSDVICSSS